MSTSEPMATGAQAPDSTILLDGESVSLAAPGAFCLVYFYPKDDTPGCTKEACGFRDAWDDLSRVGLKVLGVSPDKAASHEKFRKKYQLPFDLHADLDADLAKAFGVWGPKQFMGRQYEGVHRTSFLISPEGKILKTYPKVKPETHASEVLEDFKTLKNQP